jgi:hypothetical protein
VVAQGFCLAGLHGRSLRRPDLNDVAHLDALFNLRLNFADALEPLLRRLFEVVSLTINLHAGSDDVTITITLPTTELPAVATTARRLRAEPKPGAPDQQTHDALTCACRRRRKLAVLGRRDDARRMLDNALTAYADTDWEARVIRLGRGQWYVEQGALRDGIDDLCRVGELLGDDSPRQALI